MCEQCQPFQLDPGLAKIWAEDTKKLSLEDKAFLDHALVVMEQEIVASHPPAEPTGVDYDLPARIASTDLARIGR